MHFFVIFGDTIARLLKCENPVWIESSMLEKKEMMDGSIFKEYFFSSYIGVEGIRVLGS